MNSDLRRQIAQELTIDRCTGDRADYEKLNLA